MKRILFGFLVLSLTSINVGHSRERKVVEFGIDGGVSSSSTTTRSTLHEDSSRKMGGLFIGSNLLINAGQNLFFTADIRQTNMHGSNVKGSIGDLNYTMQENKTRMLDYSIGAGYRLGTYGRATFSPIVGFLNKRISYDQSSITMSDGVDVATDTSFEQSGMNEFRGLYVGTRIDFAFSDTHESAFTLKVASLNATANNHMHSNMVDLGGTSVASTSGHPGFRNYGIFLRYDDEYKVSENTWVKWFAFYENLKIQRMSVYAESYSQGMSWNSGGLGFGFSWK